MHIILYNNQRYNITNFISKHPGGSFLFANTQNQDITNLVNSYHKNIDLVEYTMKQYICDNSNNYDNSVSIELTNFTLYNQLKQEVYAELQKMGNGVKYTSLSNIIVLFNLVLHIYLWYQFILKPTVLLTLFLGVNSICYLGKVQHEAAHNSLSKRPMVNYLLKFTILPFASLAMWDYDHNILHHQYTNTEKDGDSNPENAMYYNIHKPTTWYYKYQHIYYCALTPLVIFRKGIIKSLAVSVYNIKQNPKYINTNQVIFEAKLHTYSFCLCYLLPTIYHRSIFPTILFTIYSTIFVVISQINHIQEHNINYVSKKDFLIDQVSTSTNYKTNWLTSYLCFGLNWQIEHHLFPTIAHEHYPAISSIVQAFCKKHDIPYTCYDNIGIAIQKYFEFLYNISRKNN